MLKLNSDLPFLSMNMLLARADLLWRYTYLDAKIQREEYCRWVGRWNEKLRMEEIYTT